jgi:AcrR family transcriptional regulator
LRIFHQYVDSKQQLLLATFEESMRATADQLREEISLEGTPVARLRALVIGYRRRCEPPPPGSAGATPPPVMVELAQHMLRRHPAEASQAFAPMVALFGELVDEARKLGELRPGPPADVVAGFALQAVMSACVGWTMPGPDERAALDITGEVIWDFVYRGVKTPTG